MERLRRATLKRHGDAVHRALDFFAGEAEAGVRAR